MCANPANNTISVINGATNSITAIVNVGIQPSSLRVNVNTNLIYVANYMSNSVSVIDGLNNSVVATVNVGTGPDAIGVNRTTNRIYVANAGSNNISVIDGSSNNIIATVNVGTGPAGIGVNSSTNRVYVANASSSNVSVIDGATNNLISTINVGTSPVAVAVNPSTNRVFVNNYGSNNVSVINGSTNSVLTTIGVNNGPEGIGINTGTNLIYVADYASNILSIIDGSNNRAVSTLGVGNGPSGVAVNPNTKVFYVSNSLSDTVSVIQENTFTVHGDVNGDDLVTMGDVTKEERIILGLDLTTPGADVNNDGDITMGDVTKIERIILGLDPLAYWRFDEGSGSIAHDSEYGNNGTIHGATWTGGLVHSALNFDGSSAYVSVPNASFNWSGDGAVELWVKTNGNIGTLLWKRFYSGSQGWTLYLGAQNTIKGYVNSNAVNVTATISPGQWQHIALVYNQGLMKLYINGVLKDTKTNSGGFQPSNSDLLIGKDENGNYFNGIIDEVAFFNRSLSDQEIQQHYQKGLQGLGY